MAGPETAEAAKRAQPPRTLFDQGGWGGGELIVPGYLQLQAIIGKGEIERSLVAADGAIAPALNRSVKDSGSSWIGVRGDSLSTLRGEREP